MKRKISTILTLIIVCFNLTGCGLEQQKNSKSSIGYVKEETVTSSVSNFNTKITDSNLEYSLSDEYFSIENNAYYYGLFEDIVLCITPLEFTENKDSDIVSKLSIYYDKNSNNEDLALKYITDLILSNSNKILTNEEINTFMSDSKNMSEKDKYASNGSGLKLYYIEDENRIQYTIVRNYK